MKKDIKFWIRLLIAILSAILGAIAESASSFISNLNIF